MRSPESTSLAVEAGHCTQCLTFPSAPHCRNCHYSHLTDEEVEAYYDFLLRMIIVGKLMLAGGEEETPLTDLARTLQV